MTSPRPKKAKLKALKDMNSLEAVVWWLAHVDLIKQGLKVCPECKQSLLEGIR